LKALDLNALVRETLHLYESDGGLDGITQQLDDSCPLVMGDAQQLRQVIHNLLQNALDASPAAAIIRTQWQPTQGRVRLAVLDNGPGFAEAILKRAFEPYVTTKAKGTGLGLAVVKKIADEHGARVDLANRLVDGVVAGAQVSLSLAALKSAPA
jgi:nitrogen fixation/metabolism regulation signal transduction histidine kinase